MSKVLRVFPDYMSSALWNETANVDVDDYNIPPITKVALKYWNDVWESWEIDLQLTTPDKGWITHYYRQWWEDGKAIAQDIQASNPDIDVVYMADTPEEIEHLYYGQ